MTVTYTPRRWHVIAAVTLAAASALAMSSHLTERPGTAAVLHGAAATDSLAGVPDPRPDEVSRDLVRHSMTPKPSRPAHPRPATTHAAAPPAASARKATTYAANRPAPIIVAPPAPPRVVTVRPAPAPIVTTHAPAPVAPTPVAPAPVAPAPAPARSAYTEESSADSWLLSTINQQRHQRGLPDFIVDSRLNASAHEHSVAMAKADTLSHQLPGEGTAGQRMSAQGVAWLSCGENAGMSGNTSNGGISAASTANSAMMAEGSGGGHYDNLMSSQFNHIGISVLYDPVHHTVWITEDFAQE